MIRLSRVGEGNGLVCISNICINMVQDIVFFGMA